MDFFGLSFFVLKQQVFGKFLPPFIYYRFLGDFRQIQENATSGRGFGRGMGGRMMAGRGIGINESTHPMHCRINVIAVVPSIFLPLFFINRNMIIRWLYSLIKKYGYISYIFQIFMIL